MRALLAVLLAVALLPGCLSDARSEDGPLSGSLGPERSAIAVEREEMEFSGTVVTTPAGGYEGQLPFTVPGETFRLQAEAEWNCVSLCPLYVFLVTPDGEVAAEAEGGSGLSLEVDAPAAGEWTFHYRARDGATVEASGTLALTYEMAG